MYRILAGRAASKRESTANHHHHQHQPHTGQQKPLEKETHAASSRECSNASPIKGAQRSKGLNNAL